jgi:CheY-like chemotaxis protein
MIHQASHGQDYADFELLVGPATDGQYPVTITHAPAGDAHSLCLLDPNDSFLQKALARLASDDSDQALLIDLGRILFERLFSDDVAVCFRSSLSQVRGLGQGLRLRLQIQAPELAALPWEYLYDPVEDCFLAQSPEIALSRYLPLGVPVRAAPIYLPLRLLAVIANPRDFPRLDLAQETSILQSALQPLIERKAVKLVFCEHATVAEIGQAVRELKPHVVHFAGHARWQQEAFMILEQDSGESRPVSERVFRELFLGADDTRLVVLNTCHSGTTAALAPLTGLAPRMLQRRLAAVVAMQRAITDESALVFAREFYRSLAQGRPIDAATAEARKGMYLEAGEHHQDWASPVLFLRAANGRLFEPSGDTGWSSDKTRRALVIEDIAPQRQAAEQVLESLGMQTRGAADFEMALQALRGPAFDVILLDMQLDEMDSGGQRGMLLLEQLSIYQPGVPVIIISALPWTGQQVRDFLREYGAFDYLHKPFKAHELRTIIQQALQRDH